MQVAGTFLFTGEGFCRALPCGNAGAGEYYTGVVVVMVISIAVVSVIVMVRTVVVTGSNNSVFQDCVKNTRALTK